MIANQPSLGDKTMQTRRKILLFLVVLVVGLAPTAFGQFASHSTFTHPELGYYDREAGAFTPLRAVAQDAEVLPAVTPTTGELVFNFTITVKSTVPKNAVIVCQGFAFVNESGFSAQENALSLATGTGATRTCSVKIFYSWLLASPSTDSVNLSYKTRIADGVQITATNGTDTSVVTSEARGSNQTIAPIKVPANGATTTETISVTL
jgi:hypothetical protein